MLGTRSTVTAGFIVAALIVWFLLFQQALASAVYIWSISEIFNHCFLILPVSFYLIYRKKRQLLATKIEPNYFILLALVPLLLLQVFGTVGDIKVFTHIAAFATIPLLITCFIGLRAAKVIAFPLIFMLMAIPVGEELIPYLQSLTADLSVFLLSLTSIPVFRSGLYIDIPAGKFLVAEACSGISFLISSVAFGSLYAHLNFVTLRSKFYFILLATIVPIIANAIRVFGIISIAHLTDMEYAAGADHLIYGWFFYLLVLAMVFAIGEFFSKNVKFPELEYTPFPNKLKFSHASVPALTSGILLLALVWQSAVQPPLPSANSANRFAESKRLNYYGIRYESANQFKQRVINDLPDLELFQFRFNASGNHGELVSNKNQFFDKKNWTLIARHKTNTSSQLQNLSTELETMELTSVSGQQVALVHWFEISGLITDSRIKAKLFETYLKMTGQYQGANVFIAITPIEDEFDNQLWMTQLDTALTKLNSNG